MKIRKRGKNQKHFQLSTLKVGVFFSTFFLATMGFANPSVLPVLNNVASGNVTVQQSSYSTTVNQASQRAIINWQSFNIGSASNPNYSVHFQQPTGGVALNRISPQDGASKIYGQLTATGQVILVNPAGIYFAPGSFVNVGGLIATTTNISDDNFNNGKYIFDQTSNIPNASIINQGTIIAAQKGLIALVGSNVTNNGLIQAEMGQVILASGDAFTMNFAGNNLVNFAFNSHAPHSGSVTNTGSLIANGGQILVTAQQAANVLDNVINLSGVVQAQSVYEQNGEVVISGDPNGGVVDIAANIDVSGKGIGQTGGIVNITGNNILIDSPTLINASGDVGGGIVNIGGNEHGQGVLPNANAVVMMPGAQIAADAITNGNGGNVVLWSNNYTNVMGSIAATGGHQSGNGGFVETSSHQVLTAINPSINTSAPNGAMGTWLLDPADVTISTAADTPNYSNISNVFTPDALAAAVTINNQTLSNALGLNNITVTTANNGASGGAAGNITVSAPITWTAATALTLTANNNIAINSNISGVNGSLNLSAGSGTNTITATGGISVNNFDLVRGQWTQVSASLPTFNVTGNFQINSGVMPSANAQFIRATSGSGTGVSPYVIADIFGLQGMGSTSTTLADSFTLGSNIDASPTSNWNNGAGFIPIGSNSTNFKGSFNGNSHTISNLYENVTTNINSHIGLFGTVNNGSISNVSVINASISNSVDQVGGQVNAGILAGLVTTSGAGTSSVNNVFTSGAINTLIGNSRTGGVIGESYAFGSGITIADLASSANVNVNFSNSTGFANIGGAIGHVGFLTSVSKSYSTGNVTGTLTNDSSSGLGASTAGGFTGANDVGNSITNSYSTGNVTITGYAGTSSSMLVGGFAGVVGISSLITTPSISNSFSTGFVSANKGTIGGFAGKKYANGTITNSFWNTNTSGTSTGVGSNAGSIPSLTGATTSTLMTQSTFTGAGWNFGTIWNIINGQSYPFLRDFYPSAPRIISGTLTGATANDTIVLANQGSLLDSANLGANQFFYFLEGNNVISQVNNSIPDNNLLLLYNTGATKSNLIVFAPSGGASLSGSSALSMAANTVEAGASNTAAISNSDLITAKGSLSSSDILYTVSGNNLTLSNNSSFATNAATTYTLNGNLSTNGNLTFNGPVSLAASAQISGSGIITFNNTVNGGAFNLSLQNASSTGAVIFNNNVTLQGLTTVAGGYGVSFLGANTSITNGVVFNNTGLLTLGNAGDVLTFAGGLSGGSAAINGTLQSDGNAISLGATSFGSNSSISTNNLVSTGAAINFSSMNSNGNTITLNAGTNGSITGANVSGGGNLIANATSISLTGSVGINLSATGTGSNNTLALNTGNSQTWSINAANAGTINGIGSFTSFQNLVGGNNGNQFVFANNSATINSINGGSLSSTNALNFQAISPVTITLTSNKFNGSSTNINSYTNINSLVGNPANHSKLVAANPSQIKDTIITSQLLGQGSMADPLVWYGFDAQSINSSTSSVISSILEQPAVNLSSGSGGTTWVSQGFVSQNINELLAQTQQEFDTDLSKIKINPYCYQAGT